MTQLTIPVFTKLNLDQDIGGPATIIETMSADAGAVLATLVLDQMSLNLCVQSIQALLMFVKEKLNTVPVRTDTISFELGVSATGKVGFLGTGIDTGLAAKLQITLKVE